MTLLYFKKIIASDTTPQIEVCFFSGTPKNKAMRMTHFGKAAFGPKQFCHDNYALRITLGTLTNFDGAYWGIHAAIHPAGLVQWGPQQKPQPTQ